MEKKHDWYFSNFCTYSGVRNEMKSSVWKAWNSWPHKFFSPSPSSYLTLINLKPMEIYSQWAMVFLLFPLYAIPSSLFNKKIQSQRRILWIKTRIMNNWMCFVLNGGTLKMLRNKSHPFSSIPKRGEGVRLQKKRWTSSAIFILFLHSFLFLAHCIIIKIFDS